MIKDILKPKSEEEIISSIGNLSPNQLLTQSADNGFLFGVKKALKRGANIHYTNNYALRWASTKGHYDIVEFLLENNADVHALGDYALQWASLKGHSDIVELLLKYGAAMGFSKKNKVEIDDFA